MDLVTLGAISIGSKICNPDRAVFSRVNSMGRLHDAAAKISHHFTGVAVELEDRVNRIGIAVDRYATTKAAGAAALISPDMAISRINVNAGG